MQIDKYIDELTKLRQAHGAELEVVRSAGILGTVVKASLPRLRHVQVDHTRTLFTEGRDPDKQRGGKVVLV